MESQKENRVPPTRARTQQKKEAKGEQNFSAGKRADRREKTPDVSVNSPRQLMNLETAQRQKSVPARPATRQTHHPGKDYLSL